MDLIRAARPNDAPPRLVLNQVGVPGRPEIPVKDFAAALGVEPLAGAALRSQELRPGGPTTGRCCWKAA
jgi:Flp pilus assembly CpaE family ATPase